MQCILCMYSCEFYIYVRDPSIVTACGIESRREK